MQIYGPNYIHGPQSIRAPHTSPSHQAAQSASPAAGGDQLSISEAGQLLNRLADIPDIRQDRVQSIRAAIADGSYETSDKLDQALEHLLDEIG